MTMETQLNRRDVVKATGGSALAAALAGCSTLIGGEDAEDAQRQV